MLVWGVAMIAMGTQASFFPFEGHHASIISFIAGGGMGALVIGMMFLSFKQPRWAYIVSIVACLAVLGQFVPKIFKGQAEFYPAYLSILLSIGLIAILGSGHMMAMKKRKAEAASS